MLGDGGSVTSDHRRHCQYSSPCNLQKCNKYSLTIMGLRQRSPNCSSVLFGPVSRRPQQALQRNPAYFYNFALLYNTAKLLRCLLYINPRPPQHTHTLNFSHFLRVFPQLSPNHISWITLTSSSTPAVMLQTLKHNPCPDFPSLIILVNNFVFIPKKMAFLFCFFCK